MLSCLVWTRGLWVFSLAACLCPVLHMAGDLFCWPCACGPVYHWVLASFLHPQPWQCRLALSDFCSDCLRWQSWIIYLYLYKYLNTISYLNHLHTWALSVSAPLLPTADEGLQATFSCVFQWICWLSPPYEQHMFIHDKRSLCFLRLIDLSIHKQRKTQASWVSATDS